MTAHPTRPETDHADSDLRRDDQDVRRDDQDVRHDDRALLGDDSAVRDDRTVMEGRHTGARHDDQLRQGDDPRQGEDMRTTGDIDTSYRSGSSADATAVGSTAAGGAGVASVAHGGNPLLGDDHDLSNRWDQVQATFVDDPRRAVSDAAGLVEDTLKRLGDTFAQERSRGEGAGDDEAGTEDLRLAMQRYREFFRRLLAA